MMQLLFEAGPKNIVFSYTSQFWAFVLLYFHVFFHSNGKKTSKNAHLDDICFITICLLTSVDFA